MDKWKKFFKDNEDYYMMAKYHSCENCIGVGVVKGVGSAIKKLTDWI